MQLLFDQNCLESNGDPPTTLIHVYTRKPIVAALVLAVFRSLLCPSCHDCRIADSYWRQRVLEAVKSASRGPLLPGRLSSRRPRSASEFAGFDNQVHMGVAGSERRDSTSAQ